MGDDRDSHFADTLLTFLAGAATGFILGILFAPSSGKETRKKIKEQAKKGPGSWLSRVIAKWPKKRKRS